MKKAIAALIAGCSLALPVTAADRVKVGFISTLSGPAGAIGADVRDGFNLLIKMNAGKLGGLPAEVSVTDDGVNPETGKQAVERMLKRDRVDFMTGIVFSAVLLPVLPAILESKTFYLSPNTGPEDYAGAKCNPYFFAVAWQNEDLAAAMGTFVNEKGFKNLQLIAPNYPGGRETLNGFKRTFKGKYTETYTKLGQLDYAAELAEMRAGKPDALFMFLPGGMGINFIKQFVAGGLSKDVQLFVPGYSADEDSIKPLGETLLGTFNTSQWAHDLDNAANRKFVEAFQKEHKRLPTMYAAQGYDTAQSLDAAIRDVKGKIEDKAALRKALEAARFASVRGNFKFNKNHYPIHDIYMRVVGKDAQGRITNRTIGTVVKNFADPFVTSCKMPV
ncbi:MAG: ABC transporter substrate-binding protein [Betaproteobacteria bacterium]|nr:ABC transporter substrate-binding protein [Betaproteobacteria bacterium]